MDRKLCTKAPPGWRCTRDEHADGPCAALPAPEVGDLFYDHMGFLFLQTEDGPTMFAEMRGAGTNLPIDNYAERIVELWNSHNRIETLKSPC
jgi:ligand-binding sensor domain-containing protein